MKTPRMFMRVILACAVFAALAAPSHSLGATVDATGSPVVAPLQPADAATEATEATSTDTPQPTATDEPADTATATPTPSLEGGGPRITPPATMETATATPDASGPRITPPVSAASEETPDPPANLVVLYSTSNASAPVQPTLPPVDALPNTGFSSPADQGRSGIELALLGSILMAVMIAVTVWRRRRA
jgi:hypothetical protein